MKIKYIGQPVKISDLDSGDVFSMYGGGENDVYMRITPPFDSRWNCVNLLTGAVHVLYVERYVIPLDACMIVENYGIRNWKGKRPTAIMEELD